MARACWQLGGDLLRIYLLGRVTIETDQQIVETPSFPGRQGVLAFAYLAARRRGVERDELAEVLWSDSLPDAWDAGLHALISKLRSLLASVGLGRSALETLHGCYELRLPEGTWIDLRTAINELDRAEGALRRGEPTLAWSGATVAASILRRPFLLGESGSWPEQQRRDLHDLQVRAQETLAAAWLQAGDPAASTHAAARAVALAAFRESAYARLMEAHLAAGNRAEAVRVYLALRDRLRDALGVSPSPRLEQLYRTALG